MGREAARKMYYGEEESTVRRHGCEDPYHAISYPIPEDAPADGVGDCRCGPQRL